MPVEVPQAETQRRNRLNDTKLTIELFLSLRVDPESAAALGPLLSSDIAPPEMPESKKARQLRTVEDAARYLQVSKSALYEMRYRGEGPPALKTGNRLRYRAGDIEDWLAKVISPPH